MILCTILADSASKRECWTENLFCNKMFLEHSFTNLFVEEFFLELHSQCTVGRRENLQGELLVAASYVVVMGEGP